MTFHTIDDFYVSDDDLKQSPSAKDGVSEEVERRLRRYGCSLIWQVCHRLDLSDASEASEASEASSRATTSAWTRSHTSIVTGAPGTNP